MREHNRRHDDVHFPLGGRGKRATPPRGRKLDQLHITDLQRQLAEARERLAAVRAAVWEEAANEAFDLIDARVGHYAGFEKVASEVRDAIAAKATKRIFSNARTY